MLEIKDGSDFTQNATMTFSVPLPARVDDPFLVPTKPIDIQPLKGSPDTASVLQTIWEMVFPK